MRFGFSKTLIQHMQPQLRRSILATLALLPTLAIAHPGHSAFDPTVAPHAGHSWEHFVVIGGVVGVIAVVVRAIVKRRR